MKSCFWVLMTALFLFIDIKADVTADLKEEELLMGNTLPLSVEVSLPKKSSKVDFPIIDELNGGRFVSIADGKVEITPDYSIDTIDNSEFNSLRFNLSIQAFDSGRYEIPRFKILVDGDTLFSNSLNLNVIPVKVKADDKIDPFANAAPPFPVKFADNSSKEKVKRHFFDFWWVYLIVIGCIGIALFFYWRYKNTGSFFMPQKQLTPYEKAVKRLNHLRTLNLWQNGHIKEYYSKLTDILRNYLFEEFGVNAMEMTSRQIVKSLKKNGRLNIYVEKLRPVFTTSDFVKFAKDQPVSEINEEMFDRVSEFVESTRPEEDERDNKEGGDL